MLIIARKQILTGLMLAAALAAPAAAAPITYVESNGSLNYPPSHNIGTFDVGVNTVSGSVFGGGLPDINDGDIFHFVLPVGDKITSATVTITNLSFGIGGVHLSGTFTLLFSSVEEIYYPIVQDMTTSNLLLTPATAAGDYEVDQVTPSSASIPNGGTQVSYSGSYGYTDSFTVEQIAGGVTAVPEPGSIVLLLSAGFGLIILKGRWRSNPVG